MGAAALEMGGGFGGEDGAAGPKGGLIAKVKRMFSSWGKKSSSAVAKSRRLRSGSLNAPTRIS